MRMPRYARPRNITMQKLDIATHAFSSNFTLDELDESIEFLNTRLRERAVTDPASLSRSFRALVTSACWAWSVHEVLLAERFLGVGFDCMAASFKAGIAEGDFELTLEGVALSGSASSATNMDVAKWVDGFLLGAALGREEQLDSFRAFPTDKLREAQGLADEFRYTLVDALKAFWTNDPSWVGLAERALEQSELDALTIMPPKMAEPYRAVARALTPIAAGDQDGFDAALVEVLRAHKAYYGRGAPSRGCTSLLSIPASGVAGLGLRQGLSVNVTSGYMPEWVLTR